MKNNIGLFIIIFTILLFAFLPHDAIPNKINNINSNILHILSFSILTLYLYIINKYLKITIFLIVLSMGVFIEIVQGIFTNYREASFYDLIYDIVSYILVIFILEIIKKFKEKKEYY